MPSAPAVRYLPENTLGRDFVVADLHGCYRLLLKELSKVRFDPHKDRLFSVGDLIDRGPDSLKCLGLIKEPWFHYVPGNHEALLLGHLSIRHLVAQSKNDFFENGGDWVSKLTNAQRETLVHELCPLLARAPLLLKVGGAYPFNVAHAELVDDEHCLMSDDVLDGGWVHANRTSLLWGRRLVKAALKEVPSFWNRVMVEGVTLSNCPLQPGLTLVYVGHSVLSAPLVHRSHVFLDCGAYLTGRLTLVNHRKLAEGLGAQ